MASRSRGHFHIENGGYGLEIPGREPGKHRVHGRAPAPEVLIGASLAFGQTGHGALKGVAVEIAHARQGDPGHLVGPGGRRVGLDRRYHPLRADFDAHVAFEQRAHQRPFEMICRACRVHTNRLYTFGSRCNRLAWQAGGGHGEMGYSVD